MSRRPRPLLFALLLLASASFSQEATLKLGDPAPKLAIAEWVKGEPVARFEEGKVYVVEFWSTTWWVDRDDAIRRIPRLSKLQKKYGDRVVVIGVTSAYTGDTLERVREFVADRGDGIAYRVAWDDGSRTWKAWMDAAGRPNCGPKALTVDAKGRIANRSEATALALLDTPVKMCLEHTWDPETSRAQLLGVYGELSAAFKAGTPAEKLDAYAPLEKTAPEAFELLALRRFALMLQAERFDHASALGAKLVDEAIACCDRETLHDVAWTIVDPAQAWKTRDTGLARRAAGKAVEISKRKDGRILAALARVHFVDGDVRKAIEIQKQALAAAKAAGHERLAGEVHNVLHQYLAEAEKSG
jgi:thiol-disulfide isomerase/thioredoxin